jgi:hypothetical protein
VIAETSIHQPRSDADVLDNLTYEMPISILKKLYADKEVRHLVVNLPADFGRAAAIDRSGYGLYNLIMFRDAVLLN